MADKEFWLLQFEQQGNWPETWLLVADDLLVSADALLRCYREGHAQQGQLHLGDAKPMGFSFLSPALLLRAAAIEALLKGRAARRGYQFVKQGRFCPILKKGNRHDLIRLAQVTEFPLNESEEGLFRRLSPYLELGRYPISTKWDAGLREHPQPGVGYVDDPYTTADDSVFLALVDRLAAAIRGTS